MNHATSASACSRCAAAWPPTQSTGRVIALKVLDLLDPAVRTVVAPDQKLPFEDPREIPEPLRVSGLELKEFALTSLGKRLTAAGLSRAAVADIRAQAETLYESAWSEYEHNHGMRHPVRFYQEGLVTAPL